MNLSKSKIFLALCLSFLLGVLLAPIIGRTSLIFGSVIFVMLISVWWNSKTAKAVGFAGLIFVCGVLRFQQVKAHNNMAPYYGQKAEVMGVVIEEPDIRDDKIYLTLGKLTVNGMPVADKMLVSFYPGHNFFYGDELSLTGKVQEPAVFDDFNYKNYLSRFGIDAVMYYPDFRLAAEHRGNKIKAVLLAVKHKFAGSLERVIPEPQNALLAGILVGQKRSIPQWLSGEFNATGTSHIVAISGYNITIIVWVLELALRRFGKKVSSLVSMLMIVAFVILTGAAASAIRAAAIGGLSLVALNIGRLKNITNTMALTAAVMVLWNPKILLYDIGFQLSFLALCGLVYLSPYLSWNFKYMPDWAGKALTATLAAQIFTLPILLYNFGQLSLVAPLTNVLVLEMVPPTMALGFVVGLIGLVWQALANLLAWPLWVLLSYIIEIVRLTAKIPYASVSVHIGLWVVAAYYALLIGVFAYGKLYNREVFG